MITTVIFDLDGVLVKTEYLKALSYARAVNALSPRRHEESEVIDAYRAVIGRSRREVAEYLVGRFSLEEMIRKSKSAQETEMAWETLIRVRMPYYEAMLSDRDILYSNRWPFSIDLVKRLRQDMYSTALATMSDRKRTEYILDVIGLSGSFDLITTADDITRGKPDPEIYLLISGRLGVVPGDCLVLEDSPAGLSAARAAGMRCIAVTTPITRVAVHAAKIIEEKWVIDDPSTLHNVVYGMLGGRMGDMP